jgi:hypothetical protein
MTQMDTDRGGSDQDLTDRTGRGKGDSGKHTDDKRSRTLAGPQDLHLRPSATSADGKKEFLAKTQRKNAEMQRNSSKSMAEGNENSKFFAAFASSLRLCVKSELPLGVNRIAGRGCT